MPVWDDHHNGHWYSREEMQRMIESKPILDHGYLKLIEVWGSEEQIIEAARMSTGKGFLGWEPGPCPTCKGSKMVWDGIINSGDYKECRDCEGKGTIKGDKFLLAYLWKNKHATPFEMPGLTVEVQAPIMVFREWYRHRVPFGYNEMSARYTPLPDVNYIPSVERLLLNSKTNKQAGTIKGADEITTERAEAFRAALRSMWKLQEEVYQTALQAGVPKELARVHLGVGRYSRMRATGNLRGWLGFLTLRMAETAQWEIRQYANAIGELVAEKFPRTWELFRGASERAAATAAVKG